MCVSYTFYTKFLTVNNPNPKHNIWFMSNFTQNSEAQQPRSEQPT